MVASSCKRACRCAPGTHPRSSASASLPPNVRRDRWGYQYRNQTTGECARLAGGDATPAQVWSAYEALQQPQQSTLGDVIDAYFRSPQFTALAAVTQSGYRTNAVKLRAVFGTMVPDRITSPHVQRHGVQRVGRSVPLGDAGHLDRGAHGRRSSASTGMPCFKTPARLSTVTLTR